MSKFQLLIVIAALILASFWGTRALLSQDTDGVQLPDEPAVASAATAAAGGSGQREPLSDAGQLAETLVAKNLFVPERGPKLDDPTGEGTDGETNGPSALELTGIGKIGDREAAIIVITARRRSNRNEPPPPRQKIFKVGDEIADTGFTLAKINFDKNEGICEVELSEPGGGSQVLKMETGDKASQTRANQATRAEVKTATVNIVQAKAPAAASASPPIAGVPGVPPAPNNSVTVKTGTSDGTARPSSKPLSQMSREERLKEVLRLRQERMKARAEAERK